MEKSLVFVIQPKHLPSLGDLVSEEKNPLSPFNGVPAEGPPEAITPGDLKRLGLVNEAGKALPKALRTLTALAAPTAYTRVHMTESIDLFEQVIFHPADGGAPVSVTTTREGLRFEDPAKVDEVHMGLRQYLGESMVRSFDFAADLSKERAVILAAFVDTIRKRVLQSHATDTELVQDPLNTDQVIGVIRNIAVNPQWLTVLLRGMAQDALKLDASAAAALFEDLCRQGHLEKSGTGYYPSEPVQRMAGRLLVLDKILHVEAGRVTPNGKVVYVGFACLQAGVNDILYLERQGDNVRFEGQSSAAILEMAGHFLREPDALKEMAERMAREDAEAEKSRAGAMPPDPAAKTLVVDSGSVGITLLIEKGANAGKKYLFTDEVTIGRDTSNSLPLADPKVSRHHARIAAEGMGLWKLQDLGSANGTFLNGDRVANPRPIRVGGLSGLSPGGQI